MQQTDFCRGSVHFVLSGTPENLLQTIWLLPFLSWSFDLTFVYNVNFASGLNQLGGIGSLGRHRDSFRCDYDFTCVSDLNQLPRDLTSGQSEEEELEVELKHVHLTFSSSS